MRRKISEVNRFPQFDLYIEYQKIERLLSEQPVVGTYDRWGVKLPPRLTMEEYIDQFCFTDWGLRGTFLSIEEMRRGLCIDKLRFTKKSIDEELVLDFIQYAANCNFRFASTIHRCAEAYIEDKNYINAMNENLKALSERLGACFSIDGETSEIFIVYGDELSASVSAQRPELEDALREYKKIDSHNDLKRKGEILCALFDDLAAEEKKLKGTVYETLFSDTMFLFDKIGVRDWKDGTKRVGEPFLATTPQELELWYDRTYTMFLSCKVISDYLDIGQELRRLRQGQ